MLSQNKKTLFIVFAIILTCSYNIFSQSGSCKCGKWMRKSATINWTGLDCTQEYDTTFCGEAVMLDIAKGTSIKGSFPPYKCSGTSCTTEYIWEVTGPTNFQNPGYPKAITSQEFSFSPTSTGNYILTITPICDSNKCDPCIIKFYIGKIADCCNCNKLAKPEVVIKWNDGKPKQAFIKCSNKSYIIKGLCYNSTMEISFSPYICEPKTCSPKYTWEVEGPISIKNENYPKPVTSHDFNIKEVKAGKYKLIITPICGDKTCQPCIININIKKIIECPNTK